MPLTYPIDTTRRFAQYRISTGTITARNKPWGNLDGTEIVGLDPDFTFLQHVEQARPEIDDALFYLQSSEVVNLTENTLTKTWEVVARTEEERLIAIDNAEIEQLGAQVSLEREVLETRLVLTAVINALDGVVLPKKQRDLVDAYLKKGKKLWKNRDRAKEAKANLEAGLQPDLKAGWEPVTPD